jgi:putative ABC transport system permease protein
MNTRLMMAGSVRVFTRYKLRSFFMSLGIIIGVASLVVMRSMGMGAERSMMDKVERMLGASGIILVNSADARRGGNRDPGKLTIADIDAIGEQLDQVIDWDPSLILGNREIQYQGKNLSLAIHGHSERAETVWERGVTRGEFFSKSDVISASRVALIGSKTAEALFGNEDPVGKQIRIGSSPFRVKGVLEENGFDPHGLDRDNEVHIPITTLMRRLVNVDTIGNAKLTVSSPEEVDETVDQIADILVERHSLADDEPDDFSIFTPIQVQKSVKKANRVLTLYLPATAGIALLVAGIVIANIMLLGVRERIGEIGLRKAVGATNRQISGQFLLESLVVSVVSGALGAGIGAAIIVAVSRTISPDTQLTPDSIALGLIAALGVGIFAGVLPARRAARLEPVEALR